MNYPVFIFHELIVRFGEIDRSIGRFLSTENGEKDVIITTTNGKLKIDLETLEKQYRNPRLIDKNELANLLAGFRATN